LILREESGRYYITSQEDFFHPEVSLFLPSVSRGDLISCQPVSRTISTQDLLATFAPPLAKLVGCSLRIAGFAYGLSARLAQAALGVWRPH